MRRSQKVAPAAAAVETPSPAAEKPQAPAPITPAVSATMEILNVSGFPGACRRMSGRYVEVVAKQGARAGNSAKPKTYFCKRNKMFLYKLPTGNFGIGPKPGGKSVAAYCSWLSPASAPVWKFYNGKAGWESSSPSVPILLESKDPASEAEEIADAVAVSSRFGQISGGYRKTETEMNARCVFYNEDDKKYIWYNNGYWLISDEVGSNKTYFRSDETWVTMSPEDATWKGIDVEMVDLGDEDEDEEEEACLFVDSDFPQTNCGQDAVEWIRGSKLQKGGKTKLYNKIEPDDVCQGALGDCWLLAAIAAIAEFPRYLEQRIFVEDKISDDGSYHINLYCVKTSSWIVITVDDFIPCNPKHWYEKSARPLFAQPNGNELYILLLEKAFAKYVGADYLNLANGFEPYAWIHLTGCEEQQAWCRDAEEEGNWKLIYVDAAAHKLNPQDMRTVKWIKTTESKSDKEMFDTLQVYDKANYIMGASIPGTTGQMEKPRDDGLVEKHAYSALQVKRVNTSRKEEDGKTVDMEFRMVQCRNPWGNSHEWKGAWSDTSDLWDQYPEADKMLRGGETAESKDAQDPDGTFWMEWADFKKAYRYVYVCPFDMGIKKATHKSHKTEEDE